MILPRLVFILHRDYGLEFQLAERTGCGGALQRDGGMAVEMNDELDAVEHTGDSSSLSFAHVSIALDAGRLPGSSEFLLDDLSNQADKESVSLKLVFEFPES